MRRLGFSNVHVDKATGLLTGIGSRTPTSFPTERMIKVTEQLFLENMRRHPNAMISAGGASRLLPARGLHPQRAADGRTARPHSTTRPTARPG